MKGEGFGSAVKGFTPMVLANECWRVIGLLICGDTLGIGVGR